MTRREQASRPGGLALEILRARYLRKDDRGHVCETPQEMFWRVAQAIAAAESAYEVLLQEQRRVARAFYRMMAKGLFMPNSPTLMNAGRNSGMSLSACFVLPVPDSIDGIFRSVWDTAVIQKAGGGTGFAFDRLRPTGDLVASSGGRTSGPISFMRVFSEATNAIQQGAFRRGANMGMMSLEHPDILAFILAKGRPGKLENFNLSVKVPDAFMARLQEEPHSPHIVANPRTGARYRIPRRRDQRGYSIQDLAPADQAGEPCYSTKDVWDLIVQQAADTGEPGVCFIDRVNADNPTPGLGRIEATNPCGEQPLLPYESCNLGSISVDKFVLADGSGMDWQALAATIRLAVRLLDDVIDANHYPVPQIRQMTLGNRKIGLGIMGFADAVALLGIRYDSDQAVEQAGRLAAFLSEQAHQASQELAGQRGSFPNWEASTWDTVHHRPMRNAACTTIAPTGSIGILAGCSSGIEPVFSLACVRRALDGKEFISVHPLLEELGRQGGWMDDRIRKCLLRGESPGEIPGFPKKLAEVLVTAHEVSPEYHVRIQAAFQEHLDNACSKTVNLPADAVVEDVDAVYRLAWELGCKGITVYRDGSRTGQTLSAPVSATDAGVSVLSGPRPRVRVTTGSTSKFRMGCGTLFVTVNRDEEGLAEVFANLGKAGGCPSQSEATCRAVSAALRSGVGPDVLVEQLKGIRCLSTCMARKANLEISVLSCPDAIARAIEEAMGMPGNEPAAGQGRSCPDCGQPLRREAGCYVCACGYNSCG